MLAAGDGQKKVNPRGKKKPSAGEISNPYVLWDDVTFKNKLERLKNAGMTRKSKADTTSKKAKGENKNTKRNVNRNGMQPQTSAANATSAKEGFTKSPGPHLQIAELQTRIAARIQRRKLHANMTNAEKKEWYARRGYTVSSNGLVERSPDFISNGLHLLGEGLDNCANSYSGALRAGELGSDDDDSDDDEDDSNTAESGKEEDFVDDSSGRSSNNSPTRSSSRSHSNGECNTDSSHSSDKTRSENCTHSSSTKDIDNRLPFSHSKPECREGGLEKCRTLSPHSIVNDRYARLIARLAEQKLEYAAYDDMETWNLHRETESCEKQIVTTSHQLITSEDRQSKHKETIMSTQNLEYDNPDSELRKSELSRISEREDSDYLICSEKDKPTQVTQRQITPAEMLDLNNAPKNFENTMAHVDCLCMSENQSFYVGDGHENTRGSPNKENINFAQEHSECKPLKSEDKDNLNTMELTISSQMSDNQAHINNTNRQRDQDKAGHEKYCKNMSSKNAHTEVTFYHGKSVHTSERIVDEKVINHHNSLITTEDRELQEHAGSDKLELPLQSSSVTHAMSTTAELCKDDTLKKEKVELLNTKATKTQQYLQKRLLHTEIRKEEKLITSYDEVGDKYSNMEGDKILQDQNRISIQCGTGQEKSEQGNKVVTKKELEVLSRVDNSELATEYFKSLSKCGESESSHSEQRSVGRENQEESLNDQAIYNQNCHARDQNDKINELGTCDHKISLNEDGLVTANSSIYSDKYYADCEGNEFKTRQTESKEKDFEKYYKEQNTTSEVMNILNKDLSDLQIPKSSRENSKLRKSMEQFTDVRNSEDHSHQNQSAEDSTVLEKEIFQNGITYETYLKCDDGGENNNINLDAKKSPIVSFTKSSVFVSAFLETESLTKSDAKIHFSDKKTINKSESHKTIDIKDSPPQNNSFNLSEAYKTVVNNAASSVLGDLILSRRTRNVNTKSGNENLEISSKEIKKAVDHSDQEISSQVPQTLGEADVTADQRVTERAPGKWKLSGTSSCSTPVSNANQQIKSPKTPPTRETVKTTPVSNADQQIKSSKTPLTGDILETNDPLSKCESTSDYLLRLNKACELLKSDIPTDISDIQQGNVDVSGTSQTQTDTAMEKPLDTESVINNNEEVTNCTTYFEVSASGTPNNSPNLEKQNSMSEIIHNTEMQTQCLVDENITHPARRINSSNAKNNKIICIEETDTNKGLSETEMNVKSHTNSRNTVLNSGVPEVEGPEFTEANGENQNVIEDNVNPMSSKDAVEKHTQFGNASDEIRDEVKASECISGNTHNIAENVTEGFKERIEYNNFLSRKNHTSVASGVSTSHENYTRTKLRHFRQASTDSSNIPTRYFGASGQDVDTDQEVTSENYLTLLHKRVRQNMMANVLDNVKHDAAKKVTGNQTTEKYSEKKNKTEADKKATAQNEETQDLSYLVTGSKISVVKKPEKKKYIPSTKPVSYIINYKKRIKIAGNKTNCITKNSRNSVKTPVVAVAAQSQTRKYLRRGDGTKHKWFGALKSIAEIQGYNSSTHTGSIATKEDLNNERPASEDNKSSLDVVWSGKNKIQKSRQGNVEKIEINHFRNKVDLAAHNKDKPPDKTGSIIKKNISTNLKNGVRTAGTTGVGKYSQCQRDIEPQVLPSLHRKNDDMQFKSFRPNRDALGNWNTDDEKVIPNKSTAASEQLTRKHCYGSFKATGSARADKSVDCSSMAYNSSSKNAQNQLRNSTGISDDQNMHYTKEILETKASSGHSYKTNKSSLSNENKNSNEPYQDILTNNYQKIKVNHKERLCKSAGKFEFSKIESKALKMLGIRCRSTICPREIHSGNYISQKRENKTGNRSKSSLEGSSTTENFIDIIELKTDTETVFHRTQNKSPVVQDELFDKQNADDTDTVISISSPVKMLPTEKQTFAVVDEKNKTLEKHKDRSEPQLNDKTERPEFPVSQQSDSPRKDQDSRVSSSLTTDTEVFNLKDLYKSIDEVENQKTTMLDTFSNGSELQEGTSSNILLKPNSEIRSTEENSGENSDVMNRDQMLSITSNGPQLQSLSATTERKKCSRSKEERYTEHFSRAKKGSPKNKIDIKYSDKAQRGKGNKDCLKSEINLYQKDSIPQITELLLHEEQEHDDRRQLFVQNNTFPKSRKHVQTLRSQQNHSYKALKEKALAKVAPVETRHSTNDVHLCETILSPGSSDTSGTFHFNEAQQVMLPRRLHPLQNSEDSHNITDIPLPVSKQRAASNGAQKQRRSKFNKASNIKKFPRDPVNENLNNSTCLSDTDDESQTENSQANCFQTQNNNRGAGSRQDWSASHESVCKCTLSPRLHRHRSNRKSQIPVRKQTAAINTNNRCNIANAGDTNPTFRCERFPQKIKVILRNKEGIQIGQTEAKLSFDQITNLESVGKNYASQQNQTSAEDNNMTIEIWQDPSSRPSENPENSKSTNIPLAIRLKKHQKHRPRNILARTTMKSRLPTDLLAAPDLKSTTEDIKNLLDLTEMSTALPKNATNPSGKTFDKTHTSSPAKTSTTISSKISKQAEKTHTFPTQKATSSHMQKNLKQEITTSSNAGGKKTTEVLKQQGPGHQEQKKLLNKRQSLESHQIASAKNTPNCRNSRNTMSSPFQTSNKTLKSEINQCAAQNSPKSHPKSAKTKISYPEILPSCKFPIYKETLKRAASSPLEHLHRLRRPTPRRSPDHKTGADLLMQCELHNSSSSDSINKGRDKQTYNDIPSLPSSYLNSNRPETEQEGSPSQNQKVNGQKEESAINNLPQKSPTKMYMHDENEMMNSTPGLEKVNALDAPKVPYEEVCERASSKTTLPGHASENQNPQKDPRAHFVIQDKCHRQQKYSPHSASTPPDPKYLQIIHGKIHHELAGTQSPQEQVGDDEENEVILLQGENDLVPAKLIVKSPKSCDKQDSQSDIHKTDNDEQISEKNSTYENDVDFISQCSPTDDEETNGRLGDEIEKRSNLDDIEEETISNSFVKVKGQTFAPKTGIMSPNMRQKTHRTEEPLLQKLSITSEESSELSESEYEGKKAAYTKSPRTGNFENYISSQLTCAYITQDCSKEVMPSMHPVNINCADKVDMNVQCGSSLSYVSTRTPNRMTYTSVDGYYSEVEGEEGSYTENYRNFSRQSGRTKASIGVQAMNNDFISTGVQAKELDSKTNAAHGDHKAVIQYHKDTSVSNLDNKTLEDSMMLEYAMEESSRSLFHHKTSTNPRRGKLTMALPSFTTEQTNGYSCCETFPSQNTSTVSTSAEESLATFNEDSFAEKYRTFSRQSGRTKASIGVQAMNNDFISTGVQAKELDSKTNAPHGDHKAVIQYHKDTSVSKLEDKTPEDSMMLEYAMEESSRSLFQHKTSTNPRRGKLTMALPSFTSEQTSSYSCRETFPSQNTSTTSTSAEDTLATFNESTPEVSQCERFVMRESKCLSADYNQSFDNGENKMDEEEDSETVHLPPLSTRQVGIPHRPKVKRYY